MSCKPIQIAIVNGANLARLGRREVGVYGTQSLEEYLPELVSGLPYPSESYSIEYLQSNCEGTLIDLLYALEDKGVEGIVLNAGAYTHTSIALLDAIKALSIPVVEVHISNVWAREEFRHTSLISSACLGVIAGLGLDVYLLGAWSLLRYLGKDKGDASVVKS